jgi:hypothetical protein
MLLSFFADRLNCNKQSKIAFALPRQQKVYHMRNIQNQPSNAQWMLMRVMTIQQQFGEMVLPVECGLKT